MSNNKKSSLWKHTYEYCHDGQSIPYAVWSTADSNHISTIVFLGAVQVGNLAQWVAESCPEDTIVVEGAQHWLAKKDGADIGTYVFGFTQAALDTVLANYTVSTLHIIAESQAVPGVVDALTNPIRRKRVTKLTLLQPLGLNATPYTSSPRSPVQLLQQRVAINMIWQFTALLSDKRLRHNHRLLTKMVRLWDKSAHAQYGSGLTHDALPSLKYLHRHIKDITIVCGEKDKLFPAAEISASLVQANINIPIRIISHTPHSPLATKHGQKLLAAAFCTR